MTTAICLKAKNSAKTNAWTSAFNGFSTDTKSCVFIKQLTKTCISTILYLRKILSDDFFEAKSFEGMTLKILKSKKGDTYILKIEQWLEGAFDAIEKKYLKRLMLDIQDAESNRTLEVYTMTFNYFDENDPLFLSPSMKNRFLGSNIKSNTIKLLQMCYAVTQTYRNLPTKVSLGMRLSYHKNTPDDYQPIGYMAWEQADPEFLNQARSIEIGITGTQHHFFKLFNKSCLSDKFFKDLENHIENGGSNGILECEKDEENIASVQQTKAKRELCFNGTNQNLNVFKSDSSNTKGFSNSALLMIPKKDASTYSKNCSDKSEQPKTVSDFKRLTVRCSCLFSKKSESMFCCLSCKFLVHSECFGVLQFDSSKKIRFYCHLCHQKENNYKCHDKIMVSLESPSDQQKLSLIRRFLRYCNMPHIKTITLKKIEKLVGSDGQQNVVSAVLNQLIENGVAIPQKRRISYLIDRDKLAKKLVHYFYKMPNCDQNIPQVSPYTLRSISSLKKENKTNQLMPSIISKKASAILQEWHAGNNQTISQQSCDIFN